MSPRGCCRPALTRKIDLAKTSLLVDSGFSFSFLTTLSRRLPITHFDFDGFVSLRRPASDFLTKSYFFFFYVLPFMMDFLHCHPAILSYRILEIIQPLISNWHEATSGMSSWDRPHPEVRPEGRETLPDKAGESTLPSRSGGEKGLRGGGAGKPQGSSRGRFIFLVCF